MTDEVVEAWSDAAAAFEAAGASVETVSLPHTEHSIKCYSVLNPCEVASNMARYNLYQQACKIERLHWVSVLPVHLVLLPWLAAMGNVGRT